MWNNMSMEPKPIAAFVLGLVAGIFILLGSVVMSMFAFGNPVMTMSGMGGMGAMGSMMSGTMMNWMMGFAPILATFGVASGLMVIAGSVILYMRPAENQLCGAIILAFSVASILGSMGGLLVGLVLGVLGGTLALTWNDATKSIGNTSVILSHAT